MFDKIDVDLATILRSCRRIAVVGLSPKSVRPSHQVAVYLLSAGYEVVPVNPGQDEILGLKCYPDLESVPGAVDIVDVFRNPGDVPGVVDSAIAIGARVIWLQLGIVHAEAAWKAREAGLTVIMDRCIKIDHQNLLCKSSPAPQVRSF